MAFLTEYQAHFDLQLYQPPEEIAVIYKKEKNTLKKWKEIILWKRQVPEISPQRWWARKEL